ncbi:MAG: aminoglycoside phosphotransferase family protein [Frankia sp.]
MHVGEIDIGPSLVARLVAAQFPQWADLGVEAVRSAGTDHAMYRLGRQMVVRLPRIRLAALQVEKEHRWLPRLAPLLPLPIPIPLGAGKPADAYPWSWSIYPWIDGHDAAVEPVADLRRAASDLGHFVAALHHADPTGGPSPGEHNSFRGVPLAARDAEVHTAIASLRGILDTAAVTAAWDAALQTSPWPGPPVWIHGDLLPANLLIRNHRLHAVIDFGGLGVGDPACDAMAAWTFLSADTRPAFRAAAGFDDATWTRGRGWALSFGLIALPYYRSSNPHLARIARRAIDETLTDHHQTA